MKRASLYVIIFIMWGCSQQGNQFFFNQEKWHNKSEHSDMKDNRRLSFPVPDIHTHNFLESSWTRIPVFSIPTRFKLPIPSFFLITNCPNLKLKLDNSAYVNSKQDKVLDDLSYLSGCCSSASFLLVLESC